MGLFAARTAAQESSGRNLSGGVEHCTVSRELSNGRQTSSGRGRVARAGSQRPLHRKIGCHVTFVSDAVRMPSEVEQLLSRRLEIEAQPASKGEVVLDQVAEARGRHRITSGHGRATSRRAGRLSLA